MSRRVVCHRRRNGRNGSAGRLPREGVTVTLVEKGQDLGVHLRNWYHLFPDRRSSDEVLEYLNGQVSHQNIRLLKGAR